MKTPTKAMLALCVQAALLSHNTNAQDSASAETKQALEQITVTAQKRTQTIKEVPSSVVAISNDSLQDYLGAGENIRALAGRVPSLQIESSNGRQSPRFYLRGLGNTDFDVNANQPVSLVFDEVALENPVLKSVPLFDIGRVEVLTGPQGTLFGRNTPAGLVKIDSAAPEFDNYGFAQGGYGSRGTKFVESAYNFAISDEWAARASFKYQERDAWIDNVVRDEKVGGYDEFAYRLQFLYDGGDTRALFKLHGFDQDGDMPQVFYGNALAVGQKGLREGFDETVIYHDGPSGFEMDHTGMSLKVEHDFSSFNFVSVTGYDEVESFSYADIDGGQGINGTTCTFDGVIAGQEGCWFAHTGSGDGLSDHYQFSQEFRISAQRDNFFYQAGVFFFREDFTVDSKDFTTELDVLAFSQVDQLTESQAIFGQVEYTLSEDTAITAGVRYTSDDKELTINRIENTDPALVGTSEYHEKGDDYINFDISVRHDINDEWTAFSRFANSSRGPVTLGRFGFYSEADTETLNSFEVGLKSLLWDGGARWNITAYTYRIDDHQLTATGGEANTNSLLNADNTFGAGVETDFEAYLSDELRLNFNMSYNKTEIRDDELKAERCASTPTCTSSDEVANVVPGPFGPVTTVYIDGNPLPRAPEWISNISLNYETPFRDGYAYAQTDWNYRSESNIFLYNAVEFVAESRLMGGVRFGYKNDDGLDLAVVGRNITNQITVDGALDFLNLTAFVNEPRYWGVEARIEF